MRRKILITCVLLIVLAGSFIYRVKINPAPSCGGIFNTNLTLGAWGRCWIKDLWLNWNQTKLPQAMEYQAVATDKTEQNVKISTSAAVVIQQPPESFNLKVPFTPQAPLADWDPTFKEACEEASALMVDYFYRGKDFTPEQATEEILKLVSWQQDRWGGHFDLTADQTAEMIKEYFGYKKVEVLTNPSALEIEQQLVQGRPVIVPAAGQQLGNPYFRSPGPIYHMLVIKGYAPGRLFITNDPGTKRGEDFLYSYEVLMNAMHDWDENNILNGAKKIIVVYPAPL